MTQFFTEVCVTPFFCRMDLCARVFSEFETFSNLTNSGESNMHRDWHLAGKMAHFCLVSISLGANGLILSELITFTHDVSLTECGWA